jgi:chemotaxis protein CheX
MQYHPIKTEYINPFIESVTTVFRTMLSLEVRRGKLYVKDGFQPSLEITGVIGLSGTAKGSVLLGVSKSVAMTATEILLGEKVTAIDHNVVDAVGELTNMIVGAAKAKLESLNMSMGLPTVVVGKNHTVVFPTGIHPIGIPFESDAGAFCLEVSLVDS